MGRPMATIPARRFSGRHTALLITVAAALALLAPSADAAPPIRSSDANPVPGCVTPERLMAFVAERNPHLDSRFRGIAGWYRYYGKGWRVRWDYAFFQMAIETNFLTFRRGDGRRGDVSETQNNFAGIGATGNGAPGEHFPDVRTGVHAQIQHLVAYSGERLAYPIAARTRERQDDIVEESQRLGRPVTFGDLARRWAVDRAYGKSIDFIADLYRSRYCADHAARSAEDLEPPQPQPARRDRKFPFPPPSGLGGPKPDKLAGPEAEADGAEVLPWLVKPANLPATVTPALPWAKQKPPGKQASKHRSQIKTIWSRGDSDKKFDPGPLPPPISNSEWADVTAVRRQSATGPRVDAMLVGPHPQTPANSNEDQTTTLPTFRIAPVGTEPSRLGGPLPVVPAASAAKPPSPLADQPCRVLSASYGGTKTLLVRSNAQGETRYTALTVLDGFEKSMFDTYVKGQTTSAQIIGEYPSRETALADARVNCPAG